MTDELKEDSPQTAVAQQKNSAWPSPGDEGYVNPDGTPQSLKQLEDNRRAAADRAAAGSSVHGAPMATPGPQAASEAAAAAERAEAKSPVTAVEAEDGLAEFVTKRLEEATEKAAKETNVADAKSDATRRTATTDAGKTTR